jgi:hypothetical protein
MATFNKVNDFVANAVHQMDLRVGEDTLAVALSNTAPSAESSDPSADGNGVLANVTEVDYTYCSSRTLTTSSSSQTSGTYKLVLADITLTATGGDVGPFRYVYIYNDTVAGDPLVGYYDYGLSLTLNDGDSFTLDFSQDNGVIQIS